MTNPFQVTITVDKQGKSRLKLSLQPDALMLRTRFRGLLAHYQVAEPVYFDLGKEMDLIKEVPCEGPAHRLIITCFGVRSDGLLELIFRNWGDSQKDGLTASRPPT